jgi:hypothetical protein
MTYLTQAEAARHLGVTRQRILILINKGRLTRIETPAGPRLDSAQVEAHERRKGGRPKKKPRARNPLAVELEAAWKEMG